jgi:hypothetical protein
VFLRVWLYCLLAGLAFTIPALGTGHFGWWWISGILVAASLVSVSRFGPRHLLAQFGTTFLVLAVVGTLCTLSEAIVFFPEMKAQMKASLVGGIVMDLLLAAVLVALARVLKLAEPGGEPVLPRSPQLTRFFVVLAGLSYVVYYEIFGSITFHFFTNQYYPHAVEQATAMGVWFWAYQWARGLMMTLAVLPIVLSLRLPRWQAALAVGMIVWSVGGGGALLVPNTMMVAAQRYIHIIEIMTQNVSLGVTAVLLLRPTSTRDTLPTSHPLVRTRLS